MKIDENTPAAKGLAYNNATEDARLAGKESDIAYIFERFVFHRYASELCQSSKLDEVEEVVKNKDFLAAVKALVKTTEGAKK